MIELRNVSYKYRNGEEVIKNISMDIDEGECICIIGKNGSGKSTLARLICGIFMPTQGSIQIDNINTNDKKNTIEIRKKVGIVFQNPESQIMFSKVYDELAFALNNLDVNNVDERIKKSLSYVSMDKYYNKDTYELSLGQKQRIVLAGVLAINPRYLVFDEPTTMLDSEGKEDVYNIISNLKKQGYTIVYITNLMDEIMLADKIVVMQNGKMEHIFRKENIMDNTKILNDYGFSMPKIVDILLELKKVGIDIDLKEWTIRELTSQIGMACKS